MKRLQNLLVLLFLVALALVPTACGKPTPVPEPEGPDLEAMLDTALLGSLDELWDLILE